MAETAPGMSATLKAELEAALGAFDISTPFSFSFAGEPAIDVGDGSIGPGWIGAGPASASEPGLEQLLTRAVQGSLYDRCYAHRLGEMRLPPESRPGDDPAFARRLAEANASREYWDPGWVIHQLGANGQVFVRKGDRERAAMPGAFISDAMPGLALQHGASVRLRAPREALGIQPGYYFAFGETLDELAEQLSLVRFYFHCSAEDAPPLLAALTAQLNRFGVPFQAKAPVHPALYDRTDAVVLYIGARFFAIAARIVASARERAALAPSVPLFAKRLWPGVAVAVEPGTGESFGSHRCRLAAEGIVAAWREGAQSVPARLEAVAARFAAAGLDLARPYLGPGWIDLFSLPETPRLP